MKNSRISLWMFIFAIAGAVTGLLAPRAVATTSVTMDFLPPSLALKGEDSQLTQGWYLTFDELNALDWGRLKEVETADLGAYLRSIGNSGDTAWRSAVAIYRHDSPACYRLRADIYDEEDATYKGTIFFTHVTPDTGVTSVYLRNDGTWSSYRVGTMKYPDLTKDCLTSGYHIHQYYGSSSYFGHSGGGYISRNTRKYSSTDAYKRFDNATRSNGTHNLSW